MNNKEAARYWEILKRVQRPAESGGTNWRDLFVEREHKELAFAALYKRDFAHGTTGHNQLMLIANLAQVIDFILANFQLVEKD